MGRHIGMPMITTSVRISPEFHQSCIMNHINFSEAMRVGISILLADKGIIDYDNNLNLHRKMTLFRMQAEEALSKLAAIEEKNANK